MTSTTEVLSLIAKHQIPRSLSDVEAVLGDLTVVGVCAIPPGDLEEISDALTKHLRDMGLDVEVYQTIKDGVAQVWANLAIRSLMDPEDDPPRWDARIPVLLHPSQQVLNVAVHLYTDWVVSLSGLLPVAELIDGNGNS